jgi:hypothetical protein
MCLALLSEERLKGPLIVVQSAVLQSLQQTVCCTCIDDMVCCLAAGIDVCFCNKIAFTFYWSDPCS